MRTLTQYLDPPKRGKYHQGKAYLRVIGTGIFSLLYGVSKFFPLLSPTQDLKKLSPVTPTTQVEL